MTIETYRDAWGIPHLRASSTLELARAQGRVTALDRAWQLEVERHRSQGTSAAFLGAGALSWDVLARRARLDDTARRCFAALERRDPETADWVRAYTDGVNEGLPAGARRAPEFTRTGLTPAPWQPWTPLGVWLATHLLFAGFPAKLWRERAIRHLGPDAVGLFATDGPGTAGSNGWLVSGARTATGHALIAGDPHRFIEDPGVYQQIHLSCPEFDVVGLAVPGVPGIAHFGHTGTVAWAITNAMADYQDLYRERLRRTGAGVQALGPDGHWHRSARHTETVRIAGEPPVEIEVIETARGPVIAGGPEGLQARITASADDDESGPGAGEDTALALRYPPCVTEDLASAAPLLDHLAALDDLTPAAARLRDRLLAWNRRMDADSTDAAAHAAVRGAVVRHLAAHPVFAPLAEPPAYPEVLLPWLALVPRIGYALEHLLRAEELYGIDRPAAVRAALEEVAPQPRSGTWSDTHLLAPWRALPYPETRQDPEPGLAGDHDCVLCTSAVPGLTDRAARGPAARYVWDLADRADSRWVVPFGADGVPGAAHHRDQLPLWLKGELVPVVTDWTLLTLEPTEEAR
ncbi:penicillin acylase family protein [Streptomyces sp. NPDC051896]|uniref:penicillin acylase family protein n=1 Tax=Streptomyces sp. NPDC051896 TaxID=3155416 RepID=UPI003416ABF6